MGIYIYICTYCKGENFLRVYIFAVFVDVVTMAL